MGLRKALGLRKPSVRIEQPRTPRLQPIPGAPDPSVWFRDKDLTTDWLSNNVWAWFSALAPLVGKECRVLEVGSFEGRSAIAFLEYLPRSKVDCVDKFPTFAVEERFDRNLATYGDRVTKIKKRACDALDWAQSNGSRYDVIYLDAEKSRQGVFALSVLAWPLLQCGGIMIWDDLVWGQDRSAADRPEYGIRLFCKTFASCIEILHDHRQMIARKIAEWPTGPA